MHGRRTLYNGEKLGCKHVMLWPGCEKSVPCYTVKLEQSWRVQTSGSPCERKYSLDVWKTVNGAHSVILIHIHLRNMPACHLSQYLLVVKTWTTSVQFQYYHGKSERLCHVNTWNFTHSHENVCSLVVNHLLHEIWYFEQLSFSTCTVLSCQ